MAAFLQVRLQVKKTGWFTWIYGRQLSRATAQRIAGSIGIGIFISVVLVSIAITLITVSFQAIKAAMANPVKSLRTE